MKKPMFTVLLAAALLGGGGASAATVVKNYDKEHSRLPYTVYGQYAENRSVLGGRPVISGDDQAEGDEKMEKVYGGFLLLSAGASEGVDNCGVTITGGLAGHVYGGAAQGEGGTVEVTENTVTVSGGKASYVYGGYTSVENSENRVYGNTVVVTGGEVSTIRGGMAQQGVTTRCARNTVIVSGGNVRQVYGGDAKNAQMNMVENNSVVVTGGTVGEVYVTWGGSVGFVSNNSVHLVGQGASYSHAGVTYEGREMQISTVGMQVTTGAKLSGNALNVSGTGIQVKRLNSGFSNLNFHLVADQLTGAAPMVAVTGEKGFSLDEGLALSFDAAEGMEWKPGTTVTLIEAPNGMDIASEVLAKEYSIYRYGNPEVLLAKGRLAVEEGQGATLLLKLTVPAVPEPGTGTLSLFALAALAARGRRREG